MSNLTNPTEQLFLIRKMLEQKMPSRAIYLWTILVERAEPWVKQADLAEKLGCSRSTVGRTLKLLVTQGLLTETGKRHLNKFKIYEMPWKMAPNLYQHIMENHEKDLRRSFPALDGRFSKPSLEECLQKALQDPRMDQAADGNERLRFIKERLSEYERPWRKFYMLEKTISPDSPMYQAFQGDG